MAIRNKKAIYKTWCEGEFYPFTGQAEAYSWDCLGCNQGGPAWPKGWDEEAEQERGE